MRKVAEDMSEYRLTAQYRQQELFQTALYDDIDSDIQPDTSVDPSAESALFEREWYSGWTVLDGNGVRCTLCSLSANGTAIDLHSHVSQPFLMQYGLIRFEAQIMDPAGLRLTLRSRYCSALNSTDNNNIEQMIRRIMSVQEPVLSMLRWPSRPADEHGRQEQNACYSMLNGLSTRRDTGSAPSSLSRIIEVYRRNAPYFRARPEYTIQKNSVPVPFHRVRALSRDSMIWSVRTGSMYPLPPDSTGGIRIGDTRYMPRETLTETALKDHHIYENLVIIGFLDTVCRQLKNTDWIERQQTEGGFHILRLILYPETQHTAECLSILEDLRKQYQHSLHLEERKIPKILSLPKQTKRFQEIPPYHDIYQHIYEWFRGGNTMDWGSGAIYKGRLADTIYEYFCWQELLGLFARKGFQMCSPSICSGYQGNRPKPPFSNIVFLRKDQTAVTLYFDPWIPTAKPGAAPLHGITLLRTDTTLPNKGYSPDFLIKVEQNHHISYAILDAKFRDMERLFARYKPQNSTICTMEESLQKYYINLSSCDTLHRPVQMLWLLQGRCITTEGTEITKARSISKGDPNAAPEYYPENFFTDLSWGAMPLNSQNTSEWANEFWSVFSSTMLE